MKSRTLAFGGGLLGSLFLANTASAATTFTDRASFDAAVPVQTLEDFEDSNVTAGDVLACTGPVDQTTNDGACFDAGDIAPGVTLLDNPGPDVDGLALAGAGFSGNPSKTLVVNDGADSFVIEFSPPVAAVGADLGVYFAAGNVDVTLYDESDNVIVTASVAATNAGTFWGYQADVPIAWVEIASPTGSYEGIDNLAFGSVCGDGVLSGDEECEPTWLWDASCDPDCTFSVCGDGFWNGFAGESCDDNNTTPGDGCDDSCAAEILFDQLGSWQFLGVAYDQDFETVYDDYDVDAADDFVIPSGETWSISTIMTAGFQDSDGTATSVDVSIHVDASGLPGAVATNLAGGSCQYDAVAATEVAGSFTVTLPSACALGEGTYWVRVQPNQDVLTDGIHYWWFQTSATGNPAAWQNPGGAWGVCATWTPVTTCYGSSAGPDLAFGVDGDVVSCGDGVVQTYLGEECDDGASNSDTTADACRTDCTDPICGDGVTDTGEECDDGASNNDTTADACRTTCVDPACGDGVIDTGEGCDDGADNSDTVPGACRTTCAPANCGDGVVDSDEECDDGTDNSDDTADACRTTCVEAACGDGVMDTGEACDDGTDNSDTEADACRESCVEATCGDGVTDTGEDCDDGNTSSGDGCDASCMSEGTGGSGTGGTGTGGSGTGNTGNTGGSATGGSGTGNTGVGLTTPASDGDTTDDGGCSCSVPGPDQDGNSAAWLGLGLVGLATLRRRRRSA